jgi:hypothetical protein
MYAGKILSKHSLSELENEGAGIKHLLDTATKAGGVKSEDEPMAVTCWSSMIKHPQLEESRAAPIVVFGLPTAMADDMQSLATSVLHLRTVENVKWARRLTCLEMVGHGNTIKLRCDELLPVMRTTAIGSLLLIVVCGDDVLFVEHYFDSRKFLQVCHELHLDNLANGERDIDADWRAARMVEKANGMSTFLPLVCMLDDAEEFSYGVVRSGESDW